MTYNTYAPCQELEMLLKCFWRLWKLQAHRGPKSKELYQMAVWK